MRSWHQSFSKERMRQTDLLLRIWTLSLLLILLASLNSQFSGRFLVVAGLYAVCRLTPRGVTGRLSRPTGDLAFAAAMGTIVRVHD